MAGKEPHASIKLYTSDAGGAEREEKRESPVIYFINWREVVSAAGVGRTLIQNISLSRPVLPSSVNSLGTTEEESTRKAGETIEKGTSAGLGWHQTTRQRSLEIYSLLGITSSLDGVPCFSRLSSASVFERAVSLFFGYFSPVVI